MSELSFPSAETLVRTGTTYAKDLVERVLTSFLGAFVGGIVITQPLNGSMWQAAAAGGAGAVVSLLKGLAARLRGSANSASLARGV
ncbi:hypothetical protein [Streptomyces sp. NPDC101132]|uniref:hypothetical protein n=1 Tax=Streptomyces sp. NPDC101132 TaxID=3366110 RepID=UPI0038191EFE